MLGVTPVILIDDTIIAGAMREALTNRGYHADPFPPGNTAEPCTTAIEAARHVAVSQRAEIVTTADLVTAGIETARQNSTVKPQVFDAIADELRRALEVLVRPCSSRLHSPLAGAIEVWEPAVVVTRAEQRVLRPREVQFPLAIDPRTWNARASDMLGR